MHQHFFEKNIRFTRDQWERITVIRIGEWQFHFDTREFIASPRWAPKSHRLLPTKQIAVRNQNAACVRPQCSEYPPWVRSILSLFPSRYLATTKGKSVDEAILFLSCMHPKLRKVLRDRVFAKWYGQSRSLAEVLGEMKVTLYRMIKKRQLLLELKGDNQLLVLKFKRGHNPFLALTSPWMEMDMEEDIFCCISGRGQEELHLQRNPWAMRYGDLLCHRCGQAAYASCDVLSGLDTAHKRVVWFCANCVHEGLQVGDNTIRAIEDGASKVLIAPMARIIMSYLPVLTYIKG